MSSLLLLGAGSDGSAGGGGAGTVAFDAVSTFNNGGTNLAGTTGSWTHTPVGTPTAIAVLVDTFNTVPSSVTYGGASMTVLGSATNTDQSSIWGLVSPPAGAQTIVLTYASTSQFPAACAISVTGSVTTSTGFGQCFRAAISTATGTSATENLTVTNGQTGDLIVGMVSGDTGPTSFSTADAGMTNRGGNISNPGILANAATASGSASVPMNWTATGGTPVYIIVAAAIQHA